VIETKHDISVIICAYTEKRWDDLLKAVQSVRQQTVQPREIIIVIDYNAVLLKRVQEHLIDVIAIENKQAKGASGSRNSGVAIAHGTVVAFLDDDAIAEPNWIEQLLVPYDDPHIAGVGGKIDPIWMGERPSWFPEEFRWIVGCTFRGMPIANAFVRNLIAANMSMRRDIFAAIGGFRESSGWNQENRENNRECRDKTKERFSFSRVLHYEGGEEAELCIRIAQQYQSHLKFYYAPLALVRHHVPEQRTRWRYFLWRCYYEGIGKAFLAFLHGTKDGLAAERAYTFNALPQGVLKGLIEGLLHRDLSRFTQAGSIIAGLSATTAGYLVGSFYLWITQYRKKLLEKDLPRHKVSMQEQTRLYSEIER
jgi:glycosyltransferase involved in cell wall biosynthesis